MAEAFICDAVRTPIGRYGGGLVEACAPTISPRCRSRALKSASTPKIDWSGARRGGATAAPTRPARTTATSPAWPLLLAGLPDQRAGRDRQPAVRLRPRCGRARRPAPSSAGEAESHRSPAASKA